MSAGLKLNMVTPKSNDQRLDDSAYIYTLWFIIYITPTHAGNFFQGDLYLVLWEGWLASDSSWEPASFVTDDLLETIDNPPVTEDRRAEGRQSLYFCFQRVLSGNTNQAAGHDVPLTLDVFRVITHLASSTPIAIQGYNAYTREEFSKI